MDQSHYPYLFQTSGYSHVDAVRAEIDSQKDWDFVADTDLAAGLQNRIASKFGIYPGFTPEQSALRTYLIRKQAGPMISTYAWGLLSEKLAKAC